MMARKPVFAHRHLRAYVMLQWSRANDGAETFDYAFEDVAFNKLQWSRANDGAETTATATTRQTWVTTASMEPRQ